VSQGSMVIAGTPAGVSRDPSLAAPHQR